ncbi:MAG TPA: prepilin-type N-terminal cleavage/methylation domain-containing protein [bacterium]|nr:prepilin-type N-terminal cleavage/methylation domain-containing protein [bacterium]
MRTDRIGFTLIELLIVVAIIGILAAIAVPNFLNARVRANVARAEADFRNLSVALESYRIDNNRYPNDFDQEGNQPDELGFYSLTSPIAYISTIPVDPFIVKEGIIPGIVFNDEDVSYYEMGSGSDNEVENVPVVHTFYLECVGPDHEDNGGGPDSFPFITNVNRYNPSNGIVSRGDVVAFGGSWTSGCFYLDGKQIGNRCTQ